MQEGRPELHNKSFRHVISSKCKICDSNDSIIISEVNGIKILRCNNCGQFYADVEAHANQIVYTQNYYVGYRMLENVGKQRYFKKTVEQITSLIPCGKLLDIGCGTGDFLEQAKGIFQIYGIETSQWAAKYAVNRLGCQIKTEGLKDSAYPAEYFDVVHCHHVIEHVEDPLTFLMDVRRILKPKGVLVIEIPNEFGHAINYIKNSFRAILFRKGWVPVTPPPEHRFYFSDSTFQSLIVKANFTIIQTNKHSLLAKGKENISPKKWKQNCGVIIIPLIEKLFKLKFGIQVFAVR